MKVSALVAAAAGVFVAVAIAGGAVAAELGSDETIATVEASGVESPDVDTTEVDETTGPEDDEAEDDAAEEPNDADAGGLVCILVPLVVEDPAVTDDSAVVEPAGDEVPATIEETLAGGTIECSGTGNERSSEVALVPRFLAHSDQWSGAEKGAAISAWAKTHSNQKAKDEGTDDAVGDDETESGDDESDSENAEPESESPGHSADAPGHSNSNSHGGNGRGH